VEPGRGLRVGVHSQDANTALKEAARIESFLANRAEGSAVKLPVATPSPDHLEFDLMCSEVEDFEPLPTVTAEPLEPEPDGEENTSLDGQILAGLVSPY
jgi:hypothetical protein